MNISHYNYDFKFPIVRKERKWFWKILKIVFNASFVLTFIFIFFFFDKPIKNIFLRILVVSPLFLLMLSTIVGLFYNNLVKNFVLIGNIIITKDIIKITNNDLTNEYLISNLRNIKITFYGSEGSEYKNNPYSMVYKEGANNYLEFEELNGKKYIYEIYVENEGKLRQAILTMENRHIPFKLVNKA